MNQIVKLADVRMTLDRIYVAEGYQGSSDNRSFTGKFQIEKGSANDKAIQAAIKAVADEAFKKQAPNVLKRIEGNNMKYPYPDGETSKYETDHDFMILTAKRREDKGQPMIQDKDGCRLKDKNSTALKAGDYVYLSVEFYATSEPNEAIRCELRGVRFKREGASIGGGVSVTEDEFADLIVPDEAADLV